MVKVVTSYWELKAIGLDSAEIEHALIDKTHIFCPKCNNAMHKEQNACKHCNWLNHTEDSTKCPTCGQNLNALAP